MVLKIYQQLIDGDWVTASSGAWVDSFDPYTGAPWARIPRGNEADADRAVTAAEAAFTSGPWRDMTATARGLLLCRFADIVAQEAEALAALETRDNGKLLSEMTGQLNYVPQWYRYYGGLADKMEGAVLPADKPDVLNFTRYEPIGPILALTSWNSPLLLVAYKLAPALAAGNTIVLKPSEHASVSTLAFAKLFEEAGFPPGVVNVVTGLGTEIGHALSTDKRIAKITYTGGEAVGRIIYGAAAQNLKGVVLELGGKSPNIVFEDANIDNAVNGVISGIFAASGQTCVAGSRLLLHASIHDEFMERFLAACRDLRLGNPALSETQIGPITTHAQYDKILSLIAAAKAEGARCIRGGGAAHVEQSPDGWFIEPTVFVDVHNDMRIAREEAFGPVLSVLRFDNEEEALEIANDSTLGLAAGVWTRDMARAIRMSDRLQAGTVWVNTYRAVSFMSPFGGYKDSGLGRENGAEAIKQYMQVKSVWMSTAEKVGNPFVLR